MPLPAVDGTISTEIIRKGDLMQMRCNRVRTSGHPSLLLCTTTVTAVSVLRPITVFYTRTRRRSSVPLPLPCRRLLRNYFTNMYFIFFLSLCIHTGCLIVFVRLDNLTYLFYLFQFRRIFVQLYGFSK